MMQIEEQFGLEGYARWFMLLEFVARQMDDSESNSYVVVPKKKLEISILDEPEEELFKSN